VPPSAPYLDGADLLFAADCVGFALPDFHRRLLSGRKLIIACPKLDDTSAYLQKLVAIFRDSAVRSVEVAHMEVPHNHHREPPRRGDRPHGAGDRLPRPDGLTAAQQAGARRMARLPWEPAAKEALARVPFFVRPLARRKVEERVRRRGGRQVTLGDVREAEARFRAVRGGKSDAELVGLMPQPNEPGAQVLVVEACHSQLSGCPNVVLPTGPWCEAIEAWAREKDVSERLRARLRGDHILFHHKLRIAVAGCPNACSRPQIADVGVVGFVRPEADAERCTACGACARACPDGAIAVADGPPQFDRALCLGCRACAEACPQECIALSAPAARVLMGGKLGRHPHLAEPVATVGCPAELVALLDRTVDGFLGNAEPGERFANYWLRTQSAATSREGADPHRAKGTE
jgi:Pyruvate/2-oxoacid:ferredoxin oxidoreductase delta subunit